MRTSTARMPSLPEETGNPPPSSTSRMSSCTPAAIPSTSQDGGSISSTYFDPTSKFQVAPPGNIRIETLGEHDTESGGASLDSVELIVWDNVSAQKGTLLRGFGFLLFGLSVIFIGIILFLIGLSKKSKTPG